jgi:excisionase family DNA binding protein
VQAFINLDGLEDLIRAVIREELQAGPGSLSMRPVGFFDVEKAAEYLCTSQGAVRALCKRKQLPFHKTPHGRLLFSPDELAEYVRSGAS